MSSAKPKQWGPEYANIFKDRSVVQAYRHRPPYPAEVFEILMALVQQTDRPWRVLDAGAGTGFVARELIKYVDGIDAVDFSEAMIESGKQLPRGDDPKLCWICGPIEDVPLRPTYNLVVAAASLHWMAWGKVLPRFAQVLDERGYVAVVEDVALPSSWDRR